MLQAAGTGSSSPLSLLAPLEMSDLGLRVSARSTLLLLSVEGDLTAASASGMGLSMPLTKRCSTFSLKSRNKWE